MAPKPKVSTKGQETREPAPPAPKATEPEDSKAAGLLDYDESASASYYSDESGDSGSYLSARSGKVKADRWTQTAFDGIRRRHAL